MSNPDSGHAQLPEIPVPDAAPQPAQQPVAEPRLSRFKLLRQHLPNVPDALAVLISLIVVTLFLHTFVLQPYLIPSESMEHTLLVGDFLLFNKQIFGAPGPVSRWERPGRTRRWRGTVGRSPPGPWARP